MTSPKSRDARRFLIRQHLKFLEVFPPQGWAELFADRIRIKIKIRIGIRIRIVIKTNLT